MLKKFGALVLALVMVLSVTSVVWAENTGNSTTSAAPTLATDGDVGVAGTWTTQDTVILQARNINIVKEIKSFNATSGSVYAPAYTYVYTVKPATVGSTVTDEKTDHTTNTAVEAPVQPGITTGLVVTGTSAGAAGNAQQAVGTLVFTNSVPLTSSADGELNPYNINLNFANVSFTKPGVYRYEITESLGDSKTYANIDVKAGNEEETKVRYLDVYVDGRDSDNDGKLDIYGYVCISANSDVSDGTTKTNGFVEKSNGQDNYYTYDLTLSKNVVNDTYAATEHAFPFTVIFSNPADWSTTFVVAQDVGTGSTGLSGSEGKLPAGLPTAWNGVVLVKDGDTDPAKTDGDITLTGIPAGAVVEVYETNDVTGVTYTVATSVNKGTAVTDNNVSWGSKPTSAVTQPTPKENKFESTKGTVTTTETTAVAEKQSVAITNTLLQISPTGVVLRIAPYVMILAAGIALLLISRRRKAGAEE